MKNIITRIKGKIDQEYKERILYPKKVERKQKIFCIGLNKTGTTSLKKAFEDLGFIVGNQTKAAKLLDNYISGNFDPIIEYCSSAQVFQDSPFSFPDTYKYLDMAYPNSQFILSIRDTPEQWYESLTKFHSQVYGNGKIPTAEDLQNTKSYLEKGRPWKTNQMIFKCPESDPYNKEVLIDFYKNHIKNTTNYFKGRKNFIVINLSEENAYNKFIEFLNIESPYKTFPWENKTNQNS